jgi:IS5 family transposase
MRTHRSAADLADGASDGREFDSARGRVQMIDAAALGAAAGAAREKGGETGFWIASEAGYQSILARSSTKGRPLKLKVTARQESDITNMAETIPDLPDGAMLYIGKGYKANKLGGAGLRRGLSANVPPRADCKDPICFSNHYQVRRLVARLFNKIGRRRYIASRGVMAAGNVLAALEFVAVRIRPRSNESAF